jgi:hypothetical protein
MWTETDQLSNAGMDPAIWSIVAAVGAAIFYVACLALAAGLASRLMHPPKRGASRFWLVNPW